MEQKIIKQYLDGTSISQLLILYPELSRYKINNILLDNNIKIRGGRKTIDFTDKQIEIIKDKINHGAFLYELAEYFQVSKNAMKSFLKRNNIKITNKNKINRRINSNYFSKIDSPIKAYWLGFLYADGSVDQHKGSGRIRIQLQNRDMEILEKFKQDLGIDTKIIYDNRENKHCCSVEFSDSQIYKDLAKYSIVPNKTYKIKHIPYNKISKEYLAAFALGLFDGDGCLTFGENKSEVTFGYTAYYEDEVKDFQNIINFLIGKKKNNKTIFTSAWHVNWRGRKQVLSILDILYASCPRHLQRKYEKYIILKNSLN